MGHDSPLNRSKVHFDATVSFLSCINFEHIFLLRYASCSFSFWDLFMKSSGVTIEIDADGQNFLVKGNV